MTNDDWESVYGVDRVVASVFPMEHGNGCDIGVYLPDVQRTDDGQTIEDGEVAAISEDFPHIRKAMVEEITELPWRNADDVDRDEAVTRLIEYGFDVHPDPDKVTFVSVEDFLKERGAPVPTSLDGDNALASAKETSKHRSSKPGFE